MFAAKLSQEIARLPTCRLGLNQPNLSLSESSILKINIKETPSQLRCLHQTLIRDHV